MTAFIQHEAAEEAKKAPLIAFMALVCGLWVTASLWRQCRQWRRAQQRKRAAQRISDEAGERQGFLALEYANDAELGAQPMDTSGYHQDLAPNGHDHLKAALGGDATQQMPPQRVANSYPEVEAAIPGSLPPQPELPQGPGRSGLYALTRTETEPNDDEEIGEDVDFDDGELPVLPPLAPKPTRNSKGSRRGSDSRDREQGPSRRQRERERGPSLNLSSNGGPRWKGFR